MAICRNREMGTVANSEFCSGVRATQNLVELWREVGCAKDLDCARSEGSPSRRGCGHCMFQRSSITRSRVVIAIAVALTVLVCSLWMGSAHRSGRAEAQQDLDLDAGTARPTSLLSPQAASSPSNSEGLAHPLEDLTPSEKAARRAQLLRALMAVEAENAAVAWEGDVLQSFKGQIVAVRMPDADQYSRMNAAMEAALAGVDPRSKQYASLRAEYQNLFNSFVSYPKKVRSVYVITARDGTFRSLQVSHVDSESGLAPKESGGAPGSGRVRGFSGPWSPGSPVYERYSHIFSLKVAE